MQVMQMMHQEGQELVCAAVSALVLNMANSIEQFTDDHRLRQMRTRQQEVSISGSPGHDQSGMQALLMNSLVLGLEDIEEEYGEPYIKIRFEEV